MGEGGHYEEDMPVSGDEAVQGVGRQQGLKRGARAIAMDSSRCTWLSWEPTALGMVVCWHLLWLSLTIMGQGYRTEKYT